jgi:hypothetical protein
VLLVSVPGAMLGLHKRIGSCRKLRIATSRNTYSTTRGAGSGPIGDGPDPDSGASGFEITIGEWTEICREKLSPR